MTWYVLDSVGSLGNHWKAAEENTPDLRKAIGYLGEKTNTHEKESPKCFTMVPQEFMVLKLYQVVQLSQSVSTESDLPPPLFVNCPSNKQFLFNGSSHF